jgi:hypothetical protein
MQLQMSLHRILTDLCLVYLSLDEFSVPLLGAQKRFVTTVIADVYLMYPFLDYVCLS